MAAAMAAAGTEVLAVAPEATEAGTWRIHNFDQRAPVIEFTHPALARPLHLEQRGATDPGFVPGTSSVAWPVAKRMAQHLAEQPELVRGRRVLELGAGIGLVGAVASALGATRAVLTDCHDSLPLLERNRECLAKAGVAVEVAQVSWGEPADHTAALQRDAGGFDVILASDVIVPGFDTDRLVASCVALVARQPEARVLVGYEFRDEWETIGTFISWMEEAGLTCSHVPLTDDEGDDDDMILYTFSWKQPASSDSVLP